MDHHVYKNLSGLTVTLKIYALKKTIKSMKFDMFKRLSFK